MHIKTQQSSILSNNMAESMSFSKKKKKKSLTTSVEKYAKLPFHGASQANESSQYGLSLAN
jgi:hypothetical protein